MQNNRLSVDSRLHDLMGLKDGWFDGVGIAVSTHLLGIVDQGIERFDAITKTYIYPTVEGGLQLEWDIADWALEAEFHADGRLEVVADNHKTGENREHVWSWMEETWVTRMVVFLREFVGS